MISHFSVELLNFVNAIDRHDAFAQIVDTFVTTDAPQPIALPQQLEADLLTARHRGGVDAQTIAALLDRARAAVINSIEMDVYPAFLREPGVLDKLEHLA